MTVVEFVTDVTSQIWCLRNKQDLIINEYRFQRASWKCQIIVDIEALTVSQVVFSRNTVGVVSVSEAVNSKGSQEQLIHWDQRLTYWYAKPSKDNPHYFHTPFRVKKDSLNSPWFFW